MSGTPPHCSILNIWVWKRCYRKQIPENHWHRYHLFVDFEPKLNSKLKLLPFELLYKRWVKNTLLRNITAQKSEVLASDDQCITTATQEKRVTPRRSDAQLKEKKNARQESWIIQHLVISSVVSRSEHRHHPIYLKWSTSGTSLGLLNPNLQFDKIRRWSGPMLRFKQHWTRWSETLHVPFPSLTTWQVLLSLFYKRQN